MTEPNTDLPPDFDLEEFRRRQRSRSRIMAVALLGLVVAGGAALIVALVRRLRR